MEGGGSISVCEQATGRQSDGESFGQISRAREGRGRNRQTEMGRERSGKKEKK